MKKFTNAVIYGHDHATELLVENGIIKEIGSNLSPADEVIDLNGKMICAPYVDRTLRFFAVSVQRLSLRPVPAQILYKHRSYQS